MRIGIDVGGTKIEGVALDRKGREAARRRVDTPKDDYDGTVAAVVDLVAYLETATGEVGSVGVGIPGALSRMTGLVKNANSTCLIGRPFDRDLGSVLDREVRLANDANCFAVSEANDGAAAGASVVFGVILGTGTGGGIAIEGRPLTGANAIAGEWGHNALPWPEEGEWPGPSCYCGRNGCVETFLSGPGLAADHARHGGGDLDPPTIVAEAEGADGRAEATMRRYERRLAKGLAQVINLLDPDVIVLGGGLSKVERLYEAVPRLWGEWVFSDRVDTRLSPPRHGDSSGVRGAAWLWPD